MYFISQIGKQDCAFACLKMLLADFHHDKNYLYLPCEEDKPYSVQEIIAIASQHNMTLKGIKVSKPKELINCEFFPIIAILNKKKSEAKHAVIVLKANHRYVTIYDPSVGKRRMNTELFLLEWTEKAVMVAGGEKTKCPLEFPNFIAKQDKITLPIFQILSGVCLLLGTYFVSDNSPYYLPLIMFAGFFLFELVFRKNLVNAMKRMDDNVFNYGFDVRDNNYSELHQTIEKYRTLSLSVIPNIIYSSMIILFVSIILVLNDAVNAVYVFLPMALAIIEAFFYEPYFKSQEAEVLEKENEITESQTDYQFKIKSTEAHDAAYRLGLNKNIFQYLEVALLLVTIVLTMVIGRVINITYIIFYLCITVLLKTSYVKLFDSFTKSEEFDSVRAKLINSLKE